ncbi:phage antirepressor protein [archaeon]|mgnify:CR=1 FL=1|nr:phage antirepressor protein [archaeon]
MNKEYKIFSGRKIRRVFHNDNWYFCVADIVEVLSESKDVRQYIKKLRRRDIGLNTNWGTICTPLK